MEKLEYSLTDKKDIPSLVACVVKTFLYDEPMTRNLGITEAEFKFFARTLCKQCVKEKLSYLCKNNYGKVIGFSLNEDLIGNGVFFFHLIRRLLKCFQFFLYLGN